MAKKKARKRRPKPKPKTRFQLAGFTRPIVQDVRELGGGPKPVFKEVPIKRKRKKRKGLFQKKRRKLLPSGEKLATKARIFKRFKPLLRP